MKNEYTKMPPQAVEVEEAVLGAMLIDKDAIHEVSGLIDTPVFYKTENQLVFSAIKSIADAHKPVDMLVVTQEMSKTGTLAQVGGPADIAALTPTITIAPTIK